MKCCVVTGATGFIGPHVVRRMLDTGWQVISISRDQQLPVNPKHTHIAADLHDPEAVEEIFATRRPSHLVHLAWEATPGKFWHSTENFRWVSSSAFLLDAFVRNSGAKAVLAGTCAEYKWENKPLDEETSPLDAATYYSASKLAFKGLAETIAKDINLVWARIFFPYGPDEDDSKLVSYIFREISADRVPVFQNPGRAVDMIHVKDVATAFEKLAAAEITGTVNVCSGNAVLPGEIALECARLLGKKTLIPALEEALRSTSISSTLQGRNNRILNIPDGKSPLRISEGLKSYLSS